MELKEDQFYLDWDTHFLFGNENGKSIEAVDAIVRGIELDHAFPPVFVYQMHENTFSITRTHQVETTNGFVVDGGHTRSVAHFVTRNPLLCQIKKFRPMVMPGYLEPYGTLEISEISLIYDVATYFRKRILFPNYI